jgi:hypothetical protein
MLSTSKLFLAFTGTAVICRTALSLCLLLSAGPRYFSRKLNATLTAAAKFGTNNVVFLTITATSDWDAVCALGGENCVDVVPRVFEAIRQHVYADLLAGTFCPPTKQVHADYGLNVNEWQKRGRPHAHMIAHFPGAM